MSRVLCTVPGTAGWGSWLCQVCHLPGNGLCAVTHPSALPAAPCCQAQRGDLSREEEEEEERMGRATGGWEAVTALAWGGLDLWNKAANPSCFAGCRKPHPLLPAGIEAELSLLGPDISVGCQAWITGEKIRMMPGKMLFMGCCRSGCVTLGCRKFWCLSILLTLEKQQRGFVPYTVTCPWNCHIFCAEGVFPVTWTVLCSVCARSGLKQRWLL